MGMALANVQEDRPTPVWASDDRAEGPASTSIPCNFRVVVLLVAQSGHASSAPQCAFGGNVDIG
jgi:hypothetical protein